MGLQEKPVRTCSLGGLFVFASPRSFRSPDRRCSFAGHLTGIPGKRAGDCGWGVVSQEACDIIVIKSSDDQAENNCLFCKAGKGYGNFRVEKVVFSKQALVMKIDYKDIITIDPGKRGGKPCIRQIRITVYDVLSWLASGMTIPEILEDFPELTDKDIYASLQFAAEKEHLVIYKRA